METVNSEDKMTKPERILILEPIDGAPLNSTGLVDRRLFTGNNTIRVVKDPRYNNWTFRYDEGYVPDGLKQKFTKLSLALEFARQYFKKRNIEIKEVRD